MVHEKFPTVA